MTGAIKRLCFDAPEASRVRRRAASLAATQTHVLVATGLGAPHGIVAWQRARFIREWDSSNHDPADAAASLAAFEKKLRLLFVEGYIMFDSGAATAELGTAKTITQIVYEQLCDRIRIRYGSRTKYLFNTESKHEVAEVVGEMKHVVNDVLVRLKVDFHEQDVYMAFEALSLATWQKLLLTATETEAQQNVLVTKARRLWRVLGLNTAWTSDKFKLLVKGALQHREELRSDAGTFPDNRFVWATFCAATPDNLWALPVIQLYVCHPDGTGDVERGLGRHARFRGAHVGAPDGQDGSTSELCLEIRMDGPQDMDELFTKADDGTLILTDFSRELATAWLDKHGRRFACQQKRSDCGKRGTGWRLKGSMKGVSQRQAMAVDALVEQADRDGGPRAAKYRATIIGTTHGSFMKAMAKEVC